MAKELIKIALLMLLFLVALGCGTSRKGSKSPRAKRMEQVKSPKIESEDTSVVATAGDSLSALNGERIDAIDGADTTVGDRLTEIEREQKTDQKGAPATTPTTPVAEKEKKPKKSGDSAPKVVNFEADIMRSIKIGQDSTALNLLGNVVLYHNGAVITCDSAVRYNDKRMECFMNVVINQRTTYAYGDRALYDGELNEARLYAPIIKMVDEDAVLYTYTFVFNTLDGVAEYGNGGMMWKDNNKMESKRGYYYVDDRYFVGVDEVELTDTTYLMESDSVVYELETDVAHFFSKTTIWNEKGDILSAEEGSFHRLTNDYFFTKDSYILTDRQEVWADKIDYNSETEDAKMYDNIQIREDEHHVSAFGDYLEYWGANEEGVLTREPSMVSYDPQESDTLYMRADSMLVFSFPYHDEIFVEERERDRPHSSQFGGRIGGGSGDEGEQIVQKEQGDTVGQTINPNAPVLWIDSLPTSVEYDMMTASELTNFLVKYDNAKREMKLRAKQEIREERKAEKQRAKEIKKGIYVEQADTTKVTDGGGDGELDDDSREDLDALSEHPDSVGTQARQELGGGLVGADSLGGANPLDSLALTESEPLDSAELNRKQRLLRAFSNVKIFRNDFQVVCDSLAGFSKDSTMHLFIDPVLWSENNQVKSDLMDIYVKEGQIHMAEFFGKPFTSAEVDEGLRYNQIKGRYMVSWFKDNQMYKNDIIGNGETVYYMTEEGSGDLTGLLTVESADITFLLENQEMHQIIYKGNPVYVVYPMESIPEDVPQFLTDFVWENDRRPKNRKEVFDRWINESISEQMKIKLKPEFPLTLSITKDMDRLIKSGVWIDRDDKLSERTLEFIESIENIIK